MAAASHLKCDGRKTVGVRVPPLLSPETLPDKAELVEW